MNFALHGCPKMAWKVLRNPTTSKVSLSPIIELIPKGNGQIDLPKWHGLFSGHDAMERCSGWAEAHPVDAYLVEPPGVHDVEVAASVHQYFGESLWADDQVDHKRISP